MLIGSDGATLLTAITKAQKKRLWKVQERLRSASLIEEDEEIAGVMEEVCARGTLQELEEVLKMDEKSTRIILVESVEMYGAIAEIEPDILWENDMMVNTKYKTVDKKVKPVAGPLRIHSEEARKGAIELVLVHTSYSIVHIVHVLAR